MLYNTDLTTREDYLYKGGLNLTDLHHEIMCVLNEQPGMPLTRPEICRAVGAKIPEYDAVYIAIGSLLRGGLVAQYTLELVYETGRVFDGWHGFTSASHRDVVVTRNYSPYLPGVRK